jgi:hypothetical protein
MVNTSKQFARKPVQYESVFEAARALNREQVESEVTIPKKGFPPQSGPLRREIETSEVMVPGKGSARGVQPGFEGLSKEAKEARFEQQLKKSMFPDRKFRK